MRFNLSIEQIKSGFNKIQKFVSPIFKSIKNAITEGIEATKDFFKATLATLNLVKSGLGIAHSGVQMAVSSAQMATAGAQVARASYYADVVLKDKASEKIKACSSNLAEGFENGAKELGNAASSAGELITRLTNAATHLTYGGYYVGEAFYPIAEGLVKLGSAGASFSARTAWKAGGKVGDYLPGSFSLSTKKAISQEEAIEMLDFNIENIEKSTEIQERITTALATSLSAAGAA